MHFKGKICNVEEHQKFRTSKNDNVKAAVYSTNQAMYVFQVNSNKKQIANGRI